MGGFGSGRRGGKTCTDAMRCLDVRAFQREGDLRDGASCCRRWTRNGEVTALIHMTAHHDKVWIESRHWDGEWRLVRYPVQLDRTACHMGGERVWWLCPASGCGRRVALLYGNRGVYACRHCFRLTYKSQRETRGDRAIRKANKMRAQLGWSGGILNFPGSKPKGMHWKTYERLALAYFAQAELALARLSTTVKAIERQL